MAPPGPQGKCPWCAQRVSRGLTYFGDRVHPRCHLRSGLAEAAARPPPAPDAFALQWARAADAEVTACAEGLQRYAALFPAPAAPHIGGLAATAARQPEVEPLHLAGFLLAARAVHREGAGRRSLDTSSLRLLVSLGLPLAVQRFVTCIQGNEREGADNARPGEAWGPAEKLVALGTRRAFVGAVRELVEDLKGHNPQGAGSALRPLEAHLAELERDCFDELRGLLVEVEAA